MLRHSIPPGSYLASAHCAVLGMHYCLKIQQILPISHQYTHRLATKFFGLHATKICQHPLIESTSVPIPKSILIPSNQRRVKAQERNCSIRAKCHS